MINTKRILTKAVSTFLVFSMAIITMAIPEKTSSATDINSNNMVHASSSPAMISLDLSGKVTADKLNVRCGGSKSYSVITVISKNTYVDIKGISDNWYKITISGKTGYVCADYVNVKIRTTATLNLRKSATTSSDSLGCIDKGTVLDVSDYKEISNTIWYKVKYNSRAGYISGNYTNTYKISDYTVLSLKTVSTTATTKATTKKATKTTKAASTKTVKTYSSTSKVVKVFSDNVKMRAKVSSSSKALVTLSSGTTLTIKSGSSGKWWYASVKKNGKTYTGYVYKGSTKETWKLSKSDYNLLCKIVMAEAGNESVKGQKMLAQAMLDRASYYNSFSRACKQVCSDNKYAVTSEVKASVNAVLNGERVTAKKVLWWYNPKACKSSWHESKTFVTQIGNHRFFTDF